MTGEPTDPLQPGMCTVIVAREGAPDVARDEALLRGVEGELGLASGTLARDPGMERPEFRLMEGVSRDVADRLAGVAVAHGYAPRVRDRLGIKWSNQRGQPQLAIGMMVAMAAGAMAMTAGAAVVGELALLLGAVGLPLLMFVLLRQWRRSTFLPLVLDRTTLAPAVTPVVEDSPVGAAAAEAREALDGLATAIDEDAPAAARGDLLRTHGELVARIDDLQRQARALVLEPSAAVATLRERLQALADGDDPSTERERASLMAALDEEAATMSAAQVRHSEILTELLGVRRTVRAAVADLQADDPERDPTGRLEEQVSALREASDEARDRVLRVRRSATRQPGS